MDEDTNEREIKTGEVKVEECRRRTLYTGFLEDFSADRIYTTPRIEIAQQEGGFKALEEISGRDYKFEVVGGLDSAISAHIHFQDELELRETDVSMYKLWESKRKNGEENGRTAHTLYDEFSKWLEGRVFTTPDIMVVSDSDKGEIRKELSKRPYRFEKIGGLDVSMSAHIVFLDKGELREMEVMLHNLWASEEMSAEEVAKRMKRK